MIDKNLIVDTAVIVIGIVLLLFNKRIGDFSEKYLSMRSLGRGWPWFPRLNAIILGIWFVVGGIIGIYDYLKPSN